MINKKNKLYKKKKANSKYTKAYKKIKTALQKELRNAYWKHVEKVIFDIEIPEPDEQKFNKQPKKLFSFIKTQKNDNVGIASLRSDGKLHTAATEKTNILNKQFQSAFTSEADIPIPDKGTSEHRGR